MKADPKGTHVTAAIPHDSPPIACRFDPQAEHVFAAAEDRSVYRFNLKSKAKQAIGSHNGWIQSLGFVEAGAVLVTGGTDGRLIWWDARADKPAQRREAQAHKGWVRCLAVSADRKIIATGGNDGLVKLWSADGKEMNTLAGHETRVYSVHFAPDGALWSGDLHGHVKRWDTGSGKPNGGWHAKELHSYNAASQYVDYGGVRSIAASPDGKIIACAGLYKASNPLGAVMEPIIQLYGADEGKLLRALTAPSLNGTLWRAIWHPENFIVACCGGNFHGFVVFWLPDQEKDLARIQLPGLTRDLDLHPDGIQLATAHYDRHIRLLSMTPEPKKA